ncbi:MAG: hypothetical protein L6265_01485 [Thermoplasmatales archaeon]|nr:hypothetical protein [Thermoplasmatales archaeon]
MPCGLTPDELDFLHYMCVHRCFGPSRAKHIKAIKRDLEHKIGNIDKIIQNLRNARYLGVVSKKEKKYYINAGDTIRVLGMHGYPVKPKGRRYLLE